MAKNPFVHIELNTDNVKQAKKFYSRLFAWKVNDMKGPMPYTIINTGSKETGGGMQVKPMPEAPTAWLPYVEVKDVKATLEKASKLGGKVVLDHMPLPGMGAIGILVDPSGAAIGVWSAGPKSRKKK